jgi:hypothetical protein
MHPAPRRCRRPHRARARSAVRTRTGSPAYPRDLRARARIHQRMDWINTEVYREGRRGLCRASPSARRGRRAVIQQRPWYRSGCARRTESARPRRASSLPSATDVVSAAMSSKDHSLRLLERGFECNFRSGSEVFTSGCNTMWVRLNGIKRRLASNSPAAAICVVREFHES